MAFFEPYTFSAILVSTVILVLAILAQGKMRMALVALLISVDAIGALLLATLGTQGLQIGWILLLPFVLAFFCFVFASRSLGAGRVFFATLGICLTVFPLVLEAGLLLPELFSNYTETFAYSGEFALARTTFSVAMVVILAVSTSVSFVAALFALTRDLWLQRKRKVA